MTKVTHYTSESVLSADEIYPEDGDTYTLTEGEIEWLKVTRGKYAIADWVDGNEHYADATTITIYCDEITQALDDDNGGAGKAAMLSDDTALQRIFFCCYMGG